VLLLTACGYQTNDLPRDPAHTSDRILASGEIRIGLIENRRDDDFVELIQARLVDLLERRMSAKARYQYGSAALLIPLLERGELDMVLGRFDGSSPWKKRVFLATPLGELGHPSGSQVYQAALRNGENAWISIVDSGSYRLREESQE